MVRVTDSPDQTGVSPLNGGVHRAEWFLRVQANDHSWLKMRNLNHHNRQVIGKLPQREMSVDINAKAVAEDSAIRVHT